MTDSKTVTLPPSYRKPKRTPPKYRCDTCGNYKCRKHFSGEVCFTHCGDWKPEPFKEDGKTGGGGK